MVTRVEKPVPERAGNDGRSEAPIPPLQQARAPASLAHLRFPCRGSRCSGETGRPARRRSSNSAAWKRPPGIMSQQCGTRMSAHGPGGRVEGAAPRSCTNIPVGRRPAGIDEKDALTSRLPRSKVPHRFQKMARSAALPRGISCWWGPQPPRAPARCAAAGVFMPTGEGISALGQSAARPQPWQAGPRAWQTRRPWRIRA